MQVCKNVLFTLYVYILKFNFFFLVCKKIRKNGENSPKNPFFDV